MRIATLALLLGIGGCATVPHPVECRAKAPSAREARRACVARASERCAGGDAVRLTECLADGVQACERGYRVVVAAITSC